MKAEANNAQKQEERWYCANSLGDPPPGTCHYCHQKTGFLSRYHKQCCDLHTQGLQEMIQLAAHLIDGRGNDDTLGYDIP